MLRIKSFRPAAAAVVASMALAGCMTTQRLAEPAEPASAMAMVSMTVTVNTLLGPREHSATEFAIGRLSADGVTVEKEILQTKLHRNYALFENLAPGKYKVLRAVYVQQTSTPMGSSTARVGSGTLTTTTSLVSSKIANFRFDPGVIDQSVVEVPAGAVAYLGDYSGVASTRMAFPFPKFEVEKVEGGRTEEGKSRAFEALKTGFADSAWLKRIKD